MSNTITFNKQRVTTKDFLYGKSFPVNILSLNTDRLVVATPVDAPSVSNFRYQRTYFGLTPPITMTLWKSEWYDYNEVKAEVGVGKVPFKSLVYKKDYVVCRYSRDGEVKRFNLNPSYQPYSGFSSGSLQSN